MAPPTQRRDYLGSSTCAFMVIVQAFVTLAWYLLTLVAQATFFKAIVCGEGEGKRFECSWGGKISLLCSAALLLGLAIAMLVAYAYMTKSNSLVLVTLDPDSAYKTLILHLWFLFIATCISFEIAQLLLLMGATVESGHGIIRMVLFSAGQAFGIIGFFLIAGSCVEAFLLIS